MPLESVYFRVKFQGITHEGANAFHEWEEIHPIYSQISSTLMANAAAVEILNAMPPTLEVRWNIMDSLMGHYQTKGQYPTGTRFRLDVSDRIVDSDTGEVIAGPNTMNVGEGDKLRIMHVLINLILKKMHAKAHADFWTEKLQANRDDWVAEEAYHRMMLEYCVNRRLLDEVRECLHWNRWEDPTCKNSL